VIPAEDISKKALQSAVKSKLREAVSQVKNNEPPTTSGASSLGSSTAKSEMASAVNKASASSKQESKIYSVPQPKPAKKEAAATNSETAPVKKSQVD